MDGNKICIIKKWLGIPITRIQSNLKDLIINHQDSESIKCINADKKYYQEHLKNNLRIEYGSSFGSDEDNLWMYYKGKEIDISTTNLSQKMIWEYLKMGLSKIDSACL